MARQRMQEALYGYIEHIHNQTGKIEHLSFTEEKDAFDRLLGQHVSSSNNCEIIWECQQALTRIASLCHHRYESVMFEQ